MIPRLTPAERFAEYEQRPPNPRTYYPWHLIEIGKWQEWQRLSDDVPTAEARRLANTLRSAAGYYARRHGLHSESRSTRGGRTVDLRFTREDR